MTKKLRFHLLCCLFILILTAASAEAGTRQLVGTWNCLSPKGIAHQVSFRLDSTGALVLHRADAGVSFIVDGVHRAIQGFSLGGTQANPAAINIKSYMAFKMGGAAQLPGEAEASVIQILLLDARQAIIGILNYGVLTEDPRQMDFYLARDNSSRSFDSTMTSSCTKVL